MLLNTELEYFIIGHKPIHDRRAFPYKALLVGKYNPSDGQNYIDCKLLPNNIEQYPYLCSYTGWYAVVANKLCHKNICCLLEYDIETSNMFNNFNIQTCQQQSNNNYIISYSRTLTNHHVFCKSTPWLEISLKKAYNIDLMNFVSKYYKAYPFWPTTTNVTIPTETLISFINWFHPMTQIFRHHPLGAYVHERAFFVFCVLHNINIIYAPNNLLIHQQKSSHQIDDLYGQILKKYNTTHLAQNMIPEYNILYSQELARCSEEASHIA